MVLDTDVLVDFFRGFTPAVDWLSNYAQPIVVPGLVAMELLQGCKSRRDQQIVERELRRFTMIWPSVADCARAFDEFAAKRLSHGIELLDTLIAHTAIGLGDELATFNVKHYSAIDGLKMVQPY